MRNNKDPRIDPYSTANMIYSQVLYETLRLAWSSAFCLLGNSKLVSMT